MEAFGVAASALAIIHLGIKSAQTSRDLLASFKDKPEPIAQLERDVDSLRVVFDRLSLCPLDASSPSTVKLLLHQLSACTKELADIETLLQRWKTKANGTSNRLRNSLRTVLREKDLEQARSRLRDFRIQLNLYLGLLQAEATASISAVNASNADATGNILQSILSQLGSVHSRLDTLGASPTADTSLSSTSGIVENDVMKACSELEESVERLGRLVDHESSTLEAQDAEQIVDDLRILLESARDQVVHTYHDPRACIHQKEKEKEERRTLQRELRAMEGMLFSAPAMAINQAAARPSRLTGKSTNNGVIKHQRLSEGFDLGCGTITISSHKQRRLVEDAKSDECHGDTVAKLLFRPTRSSAIVEVLVTQSQLLGRSVQTIPRVAINPIIAKDSLVFQIVKQGRLDEFRTMLAEGKTSVRVHDDDGNGLLYYAVGHPDLCKFLLEAGVDVDGFGMIRGSALTGAVNRKDHATLRLLLEYGADPMLDSVPHQIEPFVLACGEMDPTALQLFRQYSSHFLGEEIHTIRRCGGSKTVLHYACYSDEHNGSNRATLAILADMGVDFLARELEFTGWPARDNRISFPGFTGLHTLLFYAFHPETRDELESAAFLIEKGIAVDAVDDKDRTVSMIAYALGWDSALRMGNGSYRGDLWDAALALSGYDLAEFRSDFPRVARYDGRYTRANFEMLWRGIEDRCPYWDDRRWPETGGDSDFGSHDLYGNLVSDSDWEDDSDALTEVEDDEDSNSDEGDHSLSEVGSDSLDTD